MSRAEEFDLEAGDDDGAPAAVTPAPRADGDRAEGDQKDGDRAPRTAARTRAAWRAPLPWVAIAAVLVLAGVVVAERPSPWQSGMVPAIGTPSEEWFAPISIDMTDRPQVWAGQESVLIVTGDQVRAFGTANGQPLVQEPGEFLRCAPGEPDAQVVCVSGYPDEAELIQIDAVRGEVTRTQRPGLLAAAGHDGDLLTLHQDGEEMVLQRDDGAGAMRWSVDLGTRSTMVAPELGTVLSTAGDYVLLGLQSGNPDERIWGVYDADDGEPADEVATWMMGRFPEVSTDPWMLMNPEGDEVRYLSLDGALSEPQFPSATNNAVDDHLDSGIRVQLSEDTIYGHPDDTTEPVWTDATGGAVRLLGRVDGTVLVHRGTHASALDEHTGETVWHERAPRMEWLTLSDGEHLLAIDSAAAQLTLTGVDIATGEHVIEAAAELSPPGVAFLDAQAHESMLAVLTSEGLTLWSLDGS